ncbi:beta-hexosaminidase 2-like [Impatiens glandulifera]|uniref:beta-hexosaminidase 2-like n=1 Tax=Impatiens glandulifera TaxID=253017 RepID=UPI001FB18938|nr:beta-hexosaminidase 2-like [Impatiens glandulifera]
MGIITNLNLFSFLTFSFIIVNSSQLPINIWPKPRIFTWTSPHSILLSQHFTISAPTNHKYLSAAVRRYQALIFSEHHRPIVLPYVNLTRTTPLQDLKVIVDDPSAPLHHGVNESYVLQIPANSSSAVLAASTAWGAMRGLESFSQLVWGTPLRVAAGVYISDWPIFGHRGVLLDTSRNFYEIGDILRTIGAISENKMNVFHWHITDSHSFPLVIPSEPNLAAKGSYGDEMKYSVDDVKRVVEFGLEHGVRVLPEIDMPGHTGSWAKAYPDIVACANMFWWPAGTQWADRLASEPGTGQLNPLNPKTYKIVKNVIHDVSTMFPEPFYHAGGDEIIPGCWKIDPTIQAFISKNGTLNQVLEIFINSTLPYISSLNRTAVYWEDILLDAAINVSSAILPPEKVILQTWNNGPSNTKKIVQMGYRVIVSSSEFYYLDCGHGGFVGNDSSYNQPPGNNQGNGGSWCGPFKTWQMIYDYDVTFGLSEMEARLVLGGEVALWSEQADPTVLDSRLWPRTCAMAETLWSGNKDETGKKRYAEATDRLNEWRYRMVKRGVAAEPIQPMWCIKNRGMCDTVNVL